MQCRGPAGPERCHCASSAAAASIAFGFTVVIALSFGPPSSYARIRSQIEADELAARQRACLEARVDVGDSRLLQSEHRRLHILVRSDRHR